MKASTIGYWISQIPLLKSFLVSEDSVFDVAIAAEMFSELTHCDVCDKGWVEKTTRETWGISHSYSRCVVCVGTTIRWKSIKMEEVESDIPCAIHLFERMYVCPRCASRLERGRRLSGIFPPHCETCAGAGHLFSVYIPES